ncbi:Isonitrile hydratase [Planctomycetes bacterium Poly30]|uniref:Isonitrile hydratase n=1 Tax=Saltatorellus ferox TaxID=2528018 RepID=A0A518EZG9_9BACT|nr:Isonitrile hydratase [Planctomycetes bacterium Poly30]
MTTYGILLFPDAEELDFVGPWEVFTGSSMLLRTTGAPGDTVVTIAETPGVIRCAKGLEVVARYGFSEHPRLDVVLVPGGRGTRTEVKNPVLIDWLRRVARDCTWVTSVCTGSLLLHEAGPGRNARLATHWSFEEELEAHGATVVRDARWVRDGNVVSSQGVSAGIDMALWLVGQIVSPQHARAVQRYIQYDPAPPYQADV